MRHDLPESMICLDVPNRIRRGIPIRQSHHGPSDGAFDRILVLAMFAFRRSTILPDPASRQFSLRYLRHWRGAPGCTRGFRRGLRLSFGRRKRQLGMLKRAEHDNSIICPFRLARVVVGLAHGICYLRVQGAAGEVPFYDFTTCGIGSDCVTLADVEAIDPIRA